MLKHTTTKYDYSIKTVGNRTLIKIIDLNQGMSVTNNIEVIVHNICFIENLKKIDCWVIYRDSTGIWDGWDTVNENFIPIQLTDQDIKNGLLKTKLIGYE